MKKFHKNFSILLFKMFSLNFTTFYLYPSIWLSTINFSSIILIALDVSRNKSLFSKYGNGVKSLVNFMPSQNELMNTSVAMTQSIFPNSLFLPMKWYNVTLFPNAGIYSGSQLSFQTLKFVAYVWKEFRNLGIL